MGKPYRWFKIGEANAEIERLETELSNATIKLQEVASNDSDIANQAAALQKENESLKKQIEELNAQVSSSKSEADKAKADFADKEKGMAGEIEKQAALKAASINANLGVPPASGAVSGGAAKNFEALVAEQMAKFGTSKAQAIQFCVKAYPAQYLECKNDPARISKL